MEDYKGTTGDYENTNRGYIKKKISSKAKAIITKLVEGIRIISDPKIYLTDVDTFVSEAEQFLKEVSE